MPSTKKIIKESLREQGVSDYDVRQYADTIEVVADALDAAPNEAEADVIRRILGSSVSTYYQYVTPVADAVRLRRLQSLPTNGADAVPSLEEALDALVEAVVMVRRAVLQQ